MHEHHAALLTLVVQPIELAGVAAGSKSRLFSLISYLLTLKT
jgi:hypothetical protein